MRKWDRRQPGRPRDATIDDAILDATEQQLGRRGYEAITIDQGRRRRRSKPTIYVRHQSKRDLVGAMIDRLRPPPPSTPTGSTTEAGRRDRRWRSRRRCPGGTEHRSAWPRRLDALDGWVTTAEIDAFSTNGPLQLRNELGAFSKLTRKLFGRVTWPIDYLKTDERYRYRMQSSIAERWRVEL